MNPTQLETQTQFFEGVEKNLEVWFTNSDGDTSGADLRKIPRLVEFICDEVVITYSTFKPLNITGHDS